MTSRTSSKLPNGIILLTGGQGRDYSYGEKQESKISRHGPFKKKVYAIAAAQQD
jgi:hypothetical protein